MKKRKILFLSVIILLSVMLLVQIALASQELLHKSPEDMGDSLQPDGTEVITSAVTTTLPVITAIDLPQSDSEPTLTHGPMSGEITSETAVLWARGNQAGELLFTVTADLESEADSLEVSVDIDEASDFTGQVTVEGLEAGQTYLYRAALLVEDTISEAIQGYFTTAPAADAADPFNFVFGACLGGQGYCRDPETGWEIFDTMLAEEPDFFLFTGDTIYADSACPVPENEPGAEEPVNDLDGFRSRYRYHLEDAHYANFLAQTAVYASWDDHEVDDDFGGPAISTLNPQIFADGTQAFFEYWPISLQADGTSQIYRTIPYGAHAEFIILDTRSYRDPNVNWDPHPRNITPKTMLGETQFAWLQEQLANSSATWKFIVTSVPLSYPTGFPQPEVDGRDGWANFTEKSGYETELMALLFFIEAHGVDNVVFLTGDTHWPFALSYDPDRNGEANFYEFGSSPISALTLPPVEKPDPTFNPTVLYAEGEFAGSLFNFGHIGIDEAGDLTFRVLDQTGAERYGVVIQPE